MPALPRYETKPTPGADTWAPDIEAAARAMGIELIPWQLKLAALIGELRPDGLPRYKTIVASTPRQSGKSSIAAAAVAAKAERLPDMRLFGTAQNRIYAVRHLEKTALKLGPRRVEYRLGVGNERISWPNGSRYEVIAPTLTGGHGDSIDFMLIDEGWVLERHTLAAIRPAMAARPESQTLILSTMGTVSDSDAWNELVRQGREATEDDATRIAYLEYSAPDEPAVFDPTRWHEWMPALGYFLPPDEIADNMALLTPADFVRAWGNMTVETLAVVFPQEWIERAWRSALPPAQRFTVAIEVNEEPAGATIAAGYELEPGVMAVRTLEWRYGSPAWVPKVIEAMLSRRDLDAIVADFGGPTRQLLAALTVLAEGRLVALIDRKPRQLGADTAGFYDALKEGTVQLERNEYLEAALRGAYRKDIGDLWIPHRRRMAVDASPLLSAVMAYGVAKEYALTPRLPAIY